MRTPKLQWRRGRGSLALVAALVLLTWAVATHLLRATRAPENSVTLTAGAFDTTRATVAGMLAHAVKGVDVRVVETTDTDDALDRVDRGSIDFVLVSGAFRLGHRPNLREITPLYIEALHLLVKPEIATRPDWSLRDLEGRTVDLGPIDTETAGLATAVMDFADLAPGDSTKPGTFVARNYEISDLEAMIQRNDPSALPDAVFHLATVPSTIATKLVHEGYRLVPLPFADAFRLEALISNRRVDGAASEIDHQFTHDTVIPAYTYLAEPAVPAADLHTLGTRLLLVSGKQVRGSTVERLLDAAFTSRFARVGDPPLDPALLHLPPQIEQHEGALRYMHRGEPLITNESADQLSTTYSVVSALAGSALLVWQWLRRRRDDDREQVFGNYILRIASMEQRTAELELSASIDVERLIALQKELLQLKSEALERFAAGDLGDHTTLSSLLNLVNAAADHIGDLMLHCRDNLEEKAQAEGRSAEAVWTEATEIAADSSLIPEESQKD